MDPRRLAAIRERDDMLSRALFLYSRIGRPAIDERGRQVVVPFGALDLLGPVPGGPATGRRPRAEHFGRVRFDLPESKSPVAATRGQ